MGLFKKIFSEKELELYAPIGGKVVPLSSVSDPTFGKGVLGDGVAILPDGSDVIAPCDGVVEVMFETGHAVVIKSNNGMEILIHVGLDTVLLKGEHFTVHVAAGEKIVKGQKLITADFSSIIEKGYDVITPMVICNTSEFSKINKHENLHVKALDKVIGVIK